MKMERGFRVCVLSSLLTAIAFPVALWAAESQPATESGRTVKTDNGTEIIGDQDSAVGLFLTPWKNETAADIDRAPGLFDSKSSPIDPKVFAQKVENDDALAGYRRSRTQSNR